MATKNQQLPLLDTHILGEVMSSFAAGRADSPGNSAESDGPEPDEVQIQRSLVALLDGSGLMNAKRIAFSATASRIINVLDRKPRQQTGLADSRIEKPSRKLAEVTLISADEHRLTTAQRIASRVAADLAETAALAPPGKATRPGRIKIAFTDRNERAKYFRSIAFEMHIELKDKSTDKNRKVMLDCGHSMWTSGAGRNGIFCANCANGVPAHLAERGLTVKKLASVQSAFKTRMEKNAVETITRKSGGKLRPGINAPALIPQVANDAGAFRRSVVTFVSAPIDPHTGAALRDRLAYLSCGHYSPVGVRSTGANRVDCKQCPTGAPAAPPPTHIERDELMKMLVAARESDAAVLIANGTRRYRAHRNRPRGC